MPPLSPPRTRAVVIARRQEVALRRTVGSEIRIVRLDAGVSLRRLAPTAGLSHGLLAAFEAGDVSPSFEAFTRIAHALGGQPIVRINPGTGPIIRDHLQAAMRPGADVSRLLILRVTHATLDVARTYSEVLATAYPARHTDAVAALTGTLQWPGPALVWMDVRKGLATLREVPPRGVVAGR